MQTILQILKTIPFSQLLLLYITRSVQPDITQFLNLAKLLFLSFLIDTGTVHRIDYNRDKIDKPHLKSFLPRRRYKVHGKNIKTGNIRKPMKLIQMFFCKIYLFSIYHPCQKLPVNLSIMDVMAIQQAVPRQFLLRHSKKPIVICPLHADIHIIIPWSKPLMPNGAKQSAPFRKILYLMFFADLVYVL